MKAPSSSSYSPLMEPEEEMWFVGKSNFHNRANFSTANNSSKNGNQKDDGSNFEQDLFDVSLTDEGSNLPSIHSIQSSDTINSGANYSSLINGSGSMEPKQKQRLTFFQRTKRRIVSTSNDSFQTLSDYLGGKTKLRCFNMNECNSSRVVDCLGKLLGKGRYRRNLTIFISIIGIYNLVMIDSKQNVYQEEEQQLQRRKQQQQEVTSKEESGFWGRNVFSSNRQVNNPHKVEWSFPQLNERPFSLLKDVEEPLDYISDVPLFWHVHKSGGSTMKHIFSCLQLVQTRRMNKPDCSSEQGNPLKICNLPFISEQFGGTDVINVDCSSPAGIDRAMELQLMSFHTDPFIIDTSRVYDALSLLTETRKGRLFILFRHPVERIISKYYYTKTATWETGWPYQDIVANMTLTEYAESKYCHSNWVTRRLINKMNVMELTEEDFQFAKEILRRKAFVLLLDELEDSIQQMQQYFHWHINEGPHEYEQKYCVDEFINHHPVNVNKDKGTPTEKEWNLIRNRNLYDIHLMAYAKLLYKEQKENLMNQEQWQTKI